jgi:AcrR family transcriptional regulator
VPDTGPKAVSHTPRARRRAARALDTGPAREDALLDAAAAEFNLYGVSGASLPRIARAIGLTRAALYYYFKSREDLAFRCYLRACGITAADLAAAEKGGRNGLQRVQGFIRQALDPKRAPGVVPSEIARLNEDQRARVEAAHGRNVATLTRFIREGIDDRSIRECDAEVAAQSIFGMVYWSPLAEEWAEGTGEEVRRRAAQALSDLVTHGVASKPDRPFSCALDVQAFAFRPKNAFDRDEAAAMKIEMLTRTASRLFNRRGIDGTSLDQITQELGATKGAFYQYIADKTTLVVECHRRQLVLSARIAEAAGKAGSNGLERAFIGLHLLVQAFAGELSPLSPLTGVEALPPKASAAIRRRGQELAARYAQYNQEGFADGSFRPFDSRTLATVGAGVFSWIPKWRTDGDSRSPRFIADEISALFVRGLRRRA